MAIVASPTVRIIVPPTDAVTIVVTLPEPLASDARKHFAAMTADHLRYGFKHFSFGEWVEDVIKDRVYGNMAPWPDETR